MITGMDIQAGAKIAPAFMLKLDNEDITQDFSDRLISLTMTDNRGFEADQLDIELDDTDGQIAMPPRGATLTLWLGWQGAALIKRDVHGRRNRAQGAPDTLTIRGEAPIFADAELAGNSHGMTPRSGKLLKRLRHAISWPPAWPTR